MMKNLLLALTICIPAPAQDKDFEPGLVGEYFALSAAPESFPTLAATVKPTFVRVDKTIDFAAVNGEFHGTKLTDNFYARWTGVLRIEKAGKTVFWTQSDDGSRLLVDGKVVVDNGGQHPMTEKMGSADLGEGDHELKIEYTQGGGEAGIKVLWQPQDQPGRQLLAAKALFHKKGAEKIEWDEAAWKKRKGVGASAGPGKRGKYAEMDHGPFAAGTFDALWGAKGNWANKGIAIKLDDGKKAHVCFDPE